MSKLVDGYPNYLIRVGRGETLLVNHECTSKWDGKYRVVSLNEDDEESSEPTGDQWKVIPAKYEVCENCHGRGSHVNRAIDGNGLSREDFDEDPDFREDYMSGKYDVSCDCCHGNRVILVPATDEGKEIVHSLMDDYWAGEREVEAERRMGA